MREIKFRAWNKKRKCFTCFSLDPPSNLREVVIACGKPNEYYELTQYTGLVDKNGKEIYEGDIVRCKLYYFGLPTKTENFTVKYGRFIRENRGAGFYPFYGTINAYEVIESKVIGNIYENPELLKV